VRAVRARAAALVLVVATLPAGCATARAGSAPASAPAGRGTLLIAGGGPLPASVTGRFVALAGVSRFPIRVKCASLAWHTLKAALERPAADAPPAPVTTE